MGILKKFLQGLLKKCNFCGIPRRTTKTPNQIKQVYAAISKGISRDISDGTASAISFWKILADFLEKPWKERPIEIKMNSHNISSEISVEISKFSEETTERIN